MSSPSLALVATAPRAVRWRPGRVKEMKRKARLVKKIDATSAQQKQQLLLTGAWNVPAPRPAVIMLSRRVYSPQPVREGGVYVVDLFSGIGGWSEGARQSGHAVVLAVDSNERKLRIHMKNHSECAHMVMHCGPETEDILVGKIETVVPRGAKWHLHGSPPCQAISGMRNASYTRDPGAGLDAVLWYLALVERLQPDTWSMEEVSHPQLVGALSAVQYSRPTSIAFVVSFDVSTVGVPQHRERCIAGTPRLINRITTDVSLRHEPLNIDQVLTPPPETVYFKTSASKCPDFTHNVLNSDGTYSNDSMPQGYQCLNTLAPTCLARHTHMWVRNDFSTVRQLSVREQATLQTFPAHYQFGAVQDSTEGVGNAVPPLFARVFMDGV